MKTSSKFALVLALVFAAACGSTGNVVTGDTDSGSSDLDGSTQVQPHMPIVGQVVDTDGGDAVDDAGQETDAGKAVDAGSPAEDAGSVCHRHHGCKRTCD